MVELAVSSASLLLQFALPILENLNPKQDLLGEIEIMKGWRGTLNSFLQYSEDRESSSILKDQVQKVRDIVYEIEDVLDQFFFHSLHTFHKNRIRQKLHECGHEILRGSPLRKVRKKIKLLQKKIKVFEEQNATLSALRPHLTHASGSSSGIVHPVHSFPRDILCNDEYIGYESQEKELIHHLLKGEEPLVTLAVVGPTGSGKTEFVKNLYGKHRIWEHFDCHAWVRVSQTFDIERVLINMLKEFHESRKEPYSTNGDSHSQNKLREYLAGKRYMVVLDDVWTYEDWVSIKNSLPNELCRSRMVITTRSSILAARCITSDRCLYKLNGLESSEAWKLFCKKAFQYNNGECVPELKDCSTKIVARCDGMPLAIVAVASALILKPRLPFYWEKFYSSFISGSDPDLSVIDKALLPSYNDLSSIHKSCFLFFSVFPEDYSVECGRLTRLWVAEGFVKDDGDQKTAEEVAVEYLNELIYRHMVHVSKWDVDGRPRCCRVLNPIHGFIIRKCKEENFATLLPRENTVMTNRIRRLYVHGDFTELSPSIDFAGVRSLFVFRCGNILPAGIWNKSGSFQLSRVMDFQGAPLTRFPQQYLTLVRYLCFRNTKIKVIPDSIGKLPLLETLDLKQTDVTEIPKEISRLRHLRHLFAYNTTDYADCESVNGVIMPRGIDTLTKLQKLSLVRIDQNGGILENLKKLSKLRKLGLMDLKKDHGADLCESIKNMKNLTTLDLSCLTTKSEYLDLESMSSTPPLSLQRVYLKGRMKRIPKWIRLLNNLLKISLKLSKMPESPLQTLWGLPNLLELQMDDCYVGDELLFAGSGFKKLKILHIKDLQMLNTIVIEEESMPDLQHMSIQQCLNLKTPPLGIQNLAKVNMLMLHGMSKEFLDQVRDGGDSRYTVEHIPVIHSFSLPGVYPSKENLSTSFYHREAISRDASTSQLA